MKQKAFPAALLLSLALALALLAGIPVSALNAVPGGTSGSTLAGASGGAPEAENLEFETYRGVSMGGVLAASDPEGDAVTFELATPPVKGTVDLSPDGHFVYTPAEGKRGKDYFGYRAVDAGGNRSQEATVIIKILKPKTKVCYADTAGYECGRAAVRLAEAEIFTGECLAGRYVFAPERQVTREEFLVMCLRLAGTGTVDSLRTTGFSDDADIAVWAKPYVSAALRDGVISGLAREGGTLVFDPDRKITVSEAAVMLDRTLGLTDAAPAWFGYDESVPAWARQSMANAAACGILNPPADAGEELTRGQAALMLERAMDVLKAR